MNVILKLLYELLATTCEGWRRLVWMVWSVWSVSVGSVDRTLANWRLRLAKHRQPWRSNWLLPNFSFTVYYLITLTTNAISFPWISFFVLAWLTLPFFTVRDLIHLLLLFLEIALLLFGKERFVGDDGHVDGILGCLCFSRKQVIVLVILSACASRSILLCSSVVNSSWLLISFLEIVAK